MFNPTAMVGRALAQAATQTLRPVVTKAATQAGMGASGMRFVPVQSNLMINHDKLTAQLLKAVAKQTGNGDTQQWFRQEQITFISKTVNKTVDDYCINNNSTINKETKQHIFKAVESVIQQPLDINCAQSSISHFLQSNKYFNKIVDEQCGKGVDPITRFNTQTKMIDDVSCELFEKNFNSTKVSDIKAITQSVIADCVQDTRL
ncbi:T3SS effector protein Map [Citrobacter rodentium]|jgi:IpaB/EvcA family.|uniref:T3SS effector protein Map n=2 Tax=Citrobacter rodentium TaxID=67825 RepID=D2TKE9_CITRI|nr:T3SS effector protein Map [Citrobacter rodentium]KIQ51452.1 T3SS effector protein Map [Citrobacter rodentium]QBY29423.1 T3SS effector protein Map [Citrobacter rodentium]UHO33179.1 T3SS effector protein Map [Citrobacter rodentium NBRC 105723 = DSM 16636]CBG89719.1 T3SS effector protein Map [Citrobacter rodentium ICC168]HAT8015397.1 T3SS effector protein Map [Citrobacter rodentium NBRC 105723 = DSM 16636]